MGVGIKSMGTSEKVTIDGKKVKEILTLEKTEKNIYNTKGIYSNEYMNDNPLEIDIDSYAIKTTYGSNGKHGYIIKYNREKDTFSLYDNGNGFYSPERSSCSGFTENESFFISSRSLMKNKYIIDANRKDFSINQVNIKDNVSESDLVNGLYTENKNEFYFIDYYNGYTLKKYNLEKDVKTTIINLKSINNINSIINIHKYNNKIYFGIKENNQDISLYAIDLQTKTMSKMFDLSQKVNIVANKINICNISFNKNIICFVGSEENSIQFKYLYNIDNNEIDELRYNVYDNPVYNKCFYDERFYIVNINGISVYRTVYQNKQ